MALGEHLRADQNIGLAVVHALERGIKRTLAARAVAVDALDACLRKQTRECRLDAFRARAMPCRLALAQAGQVAGIGVSAPQ